MQSPSNPLDFIDPIDPHDPSDPHDPLDPLDPSHLTDHILAHLLANWHTISADTSIMSVISIHDNSMARYLKHHNPDTLDPIIQANVLAMLLTFHHILANPTNQIDPI